MLTEVFCLYAVEHLVAGNTKCKKVCFYFRVTVVRLQLLMLTILSLHTV